LANGADKANIIAAALLGPVTVDNPASFLQKHPRLTVILDAAAHNVA
jgi:glucosamine-6-phosphate deaminase